MKESIIMQELKKQLIKEEELFDNAKDIKSKGVHFNNINKLNIKLILLQSKIDKLKGIEENDDYIKMPQDYVVKKDEFGFGGFFRYEEEEDW